MRFPFGHSSDFSFSHRNFRKLSVLTAALSLGSVFFASVPVLAFQENDGSLFNVPGEGPPYVSRLSARAGWPPMPERSPYGQNGGSYVATGRFVTGKTDIFRNGNLTEPPYPGRPIYEEDLPHSGKYHKRRDYARSRPRKSYRDFAGYPRKPHYDDHEENGFADHAKHGPRKYGHDGGGAYKNGFPDHAKYGPRKHYDHGGDGYDGDKHGFDDFAKYASHERQREVGKYAGGKGGYDDGDYGHRGAGFSRMFAKAHAAYDHDGLNALGRSMVEDLKPNHPSGDSDTPAGYTFLGQFIDHDVTFDTTTQLGRDIEGDHQLVNARTPELDLDSVYGGGPARNPYLYRVPYLRVGRLIETYDGAERADLFRTKTFRHYGPAGGQPVALVGDPRNDENIVVSQLHAAFIALHNRTVDILVERDFGHDRHAFCKPHSTCGISELAEALPDDVKRKVFELAHDHVIHYYHRLIAEDYLPWIIGPQRTASLFKHGRDFFYPDGFRGHDGYLKQIDIPIEFAAAAFRYGHSQVRDAYQLSKGKVFDLLTDGRHGRPRAFQPVTERFLIDWRYFFDIDEHRPAGFNLARRIDPELVRSLHRLAISNAVGKTDVSSLAARNLMRGKTLHLPSGQAVAEQVLPVLAERGLLGGKGFGHGRKGGHAAWQHYLLQPDERVRYFLRSDETPLWYYILQEASVFGASVGEYFGPDTYEERHLSEDEYDGDRRHGPWKYASADHRHGGGYRGGNGYGHDGGHTLGPVGATIVGEVLTGLLDHYREKTGKGLAYKPQIAGSISPYDGYGKKGKGRYGMRNFLKDAGVVEGY